VSQIFVGLDRQLFRSGDVFRRLGCHRGAAFLEPGAPYPLTSPPPFPTTLARPLLHQLFSVTRGQPTAASDTHSPPHPSSSLPF
jgi:hypothetical protein